MSKKYSFPLFSRSHDLRNQKDVNIFLKSSDINAALFRNDAAFDWLYTEHLQLLSRQHWTPLVVARTAAQFLCADKGTVLDIGSGTGKFCLTGAFFNPETVFFGVEQRQELVEEAKEVKRYTKLDNVDFIHGNITEIDFGEFNHFYFYNSFHENLNPANRIDDTVEVSVDLYTYYSQYVYHALSQKPAGTRLVTYKGLGDEIPDTYQQVDAHYNNMLKMWIKQ